MVGANILQIPLLNAESADETTSEAIDCRRYSKIAIFFIGVDTISSGVVTIEEATFNANPQSGPLGYTGTWSTIQTYTATGVSGGKQEAVHLQVSCYAWIRTRISTAIGGGGNISSVLHALE